MNILRSNYIRSFTIERLPRGGSFVSPLTEWSICELTDFLFMPSMEEPNFIPFFPRMKHSSELWLGKTRMKSVSWFYHLKGDLWTFFNDSQCVLSVSQILAQSFSKPQTKETFSCSSILSLIDNGDLFQASLCPRNAQ